MRKDETEYGSLAALRRGLRIGIVLLAFVGVTAARISGAAVIEGEIAFPTPRMPGMLAYAFEVETSQRKVVAVAADQTRFSIEVPPGRYLVFLAPSEPGAPDIYGSSTQYSDDHALSAVTLRSRGSRVAVKIDDWSLSDEVALQLDHLRGLEAATDTVPLGAPRFSEYPIAQTAPSTAPKLELGAGPESDELRTRLQQSLAGGPNFSAYLTAALRPCGEACERLVLVDWHSGKVVEPAILSAIDENLPCRGGEALQFRRDSRLLSVTHAQGNGIVTEYYLWKPENDALVLSTEYRRSERQFCAVPPP